ncbi:MAG: tail fiber domain-containing protein [Enterobacteriaceae bacterium]
MSYGGGAALFAAFSSKKLKEDKKPVQGSALKAIRRLPVESWKYRDGIADGKRHIGPYAEDFQKVTGRGDGTTIPVVDAIGLTMKAIQELDKRVDKKRGEV